jgi:hypothetical protein
MRWAKAMVLAATAAACGGAEPPPPPEPAAAPVEAPRLPLARVTNVEIGRLANGVALTVFGEPPAPGWARAALLPRGDGPGPDGWLTFDLVGTPPLAPISSPIRALRADALIPTAALAGATGVRIRAAEVVAEVAF